MVKTDMDALVTERDLQATVLEMARWCGWRCYHTHDSRRSASGFPDLTLVRRGRIIFAELKRQNGKATPIQQAWLGDLAVCPGVECCLWRPSDKDSIARTLA